MYKCLVTKLKESVDNPNLPKFGEITFSVNSSSTPEGQVLRFETEGVTLDIPSGFNRPDSTHLASGVYSVKAYSKYDMTKLVVGDSGISYSVSDLQYSLNLTDLRLYSLGSSVVAANVSVLSNMTKLTNLVLTIPVTGNLSSLSGLVNMLSADIVEVSTLTGDISVLGTWIKCNQFNFSSSPNLSGTLEGLCSAIMTNGRTTGTINFRGNGSTISFHGVVIPLNSYRYIRYLNGVITVATDNTFNTIVGTYNGSWSYQ